MVSILGSLLYGLVFVNAGLIPAFIIVTIASIILPPIAKKQRGKKGKKGKVAEIIAIILGGIEFLLYCFCPNKSVYAYWFSGMGCLWTCLQIC